MKYRCDCYDKEDRLRLSAEFSLPENTPTDKIVGLAEKWAKLHTNKVKYFKVTPIKEEKKPFDPSNNIYHGEKAHCKNCDASGSCFETIGDMKLDEINPLWGYQDFRCWSCGKKHTGQYRLVEMDTL